MGEDKLFQVCYEGNLSLEVCDALRRLGAEPNFDESWLVRVSARRHAPGLVRYLRMRIGADARLLVARTQFSRHRDFLLVRHSLTPGYDYRELHDAIGRLGDVLPLPFESAFVVQSPDPTDSRLLGEALSELCPDASIMVMGIAHDFAYCRSGLSRMFLPCGGERLEPAFRAF